MFYIDFPSWIKPEIIPGFFLRWYALMYIVAFGVASYMFNYQIKKDKIDVKKEQSSDFMFWGILGLILGARIFSVFVYDDARLFNLTHPWLIFWPFSGGKLVGLQGMSYHGGAIGGTLGCYLYTRKHKLNFFQWADMICAAIPFGYFFGRIGNFTNGELYGRVTTSPLGIKFPDATTERLSVGKAWVVDIAQKVGIDVGGLSSVNLPRHPSQLYEAFFEGIILGLILWFIVRLKKPFHGFLMGAYMFGYGFFRFFIEYFREPDQHIGYVINWGAKNENFNIAHSALNFSTGQILCFFMMLAGVAIILLAKRADKKRHEKI